MARSWKKNVEQHPLNQMSNLQLEEEQCNIQENQQPKRQAFDATNIDKRVLDERQQSVQKKQGWKSMTTDTKPRGYLEPIATHSGIKHVDQEVYQTEQQASRTPYSEGQRGNEQRMPSQGGEYSSQIVPRLTRRRTGGTQGRQISLITNHFPLNLGRVQEAIHYDVAIEPDRPKKLFPAVMEEFRRKYYYSRYPSFDGAKNLYSAKPLPFPSGEICGEVSVVEDGRTREFKVTVKFAANVDLSCIKKYINQQGFLQIPQRALQCLDVVLRSAASLSCIPFGRSYFTMPKPGQTYQLGDGAELYYGFYQSAILGWKPFLNVDVAHKAFPMAMNIIDLIIDMFENIDLNSELCYKDYERLNDHLRGLKVKYEIPGQVSSRRIYRVNELAPTPTKAQFNLMNDQKNSHTTVQKYFENVKRVTLRYPKLPCLWVGSKSRDDKVLLPCEFCTVISGQAVNRKMTDNQTRNLIRKTATNTQTRLNNILHSVDQANYNRSNSVREFDISVSESPQELRGRVLTPPSLKYRDKEERVFKGTWRASAFQFGAELKTWTILSCDRRTRQDSLKDLERQVVQCGRALGMTVDPARRPFAQLTSSGKKLLAELKTYFGCKRDFQLIVVVLSDENFVYHYVKQASELSAGCLTQCIKRNTLNRLNKSTMDNILLKINAKRNGLNHSLTMKPKCLRRPCMIMGADVTHPGPQTKDIPSISAVTASYECKAFKYNFSWRLQDPREEIIRDLQDIIRQHLLYFYRANNGTKPESIIFFRDGVSEGQFDQVLNIELKAIRRACSSLQQAYKPKITFLVVQKRHHTRFFPVDMRDSEDKNGNVPAGTCVDTVITPPAAQDFYLVSHASIQGVVKPTKYCTLWDDADMDDDEMEQLTYYLCHLFARCTRSVSYPAPTYYAHLAAARARVYCETENINMEKLEREQDRLRVQECIIKDLPMYFV